MTLTCSDAQKPTSARVGVALHLLLALLVPALSAAAEWPQFRGLDRDGRSPETGIATLWPEGGPPEIFRVSVGEGYSGIAVAGGRLMTLEAEGNEEFAVCFAAETGERLWQTRLGPLFEEAYGNGPRSTPTLDGDTAYVLSALGHLAALDVETGALRWQVDLKERFDSEVPIWGFSASPLVVGERLVLEVGGNKDEKRWAIAGLDKRSGATLWTLPSQRISYSSPILVDGRGSPQIVFVNDDDLLAVSTEGDLLWSHPIEPGRGIKIANPLLVPPDLLLVSLSYDVGAVAVRLTHQGGKPGVEEVWASRALRNHFNGSVVVDGFVYGFDNSTLKCIEAATGEERWAQRGGLGKGSLIYVDGHLVVLTEGGRLLLVEATPQEYREKASHAVFSGRSWTSPSLADGRLYLRDQKQLVSLDLRGPETRDDAELTRLLAAHVEAMGGRDAIAAVEAIAITGRYAYNGIEHPFTLHRQRPNRYRFELDVEGRKVVQASDGEHEWELNELIAPTPDAIRDRDDLAKIDGRVVALIDRFVVDPDFDGPLVDPAAKGLEIERLGLVTLDSGEAHHLRVHRADDRTEDWYLDRETLQPRRKVMERKHPWWGGLYQRVWFYQDYRPVGDVLYSHYVEQEDRMWVRAYTIEQIEIDPEIDPAIFEPPTGASESDPAH